MEELVTVAGTAGVGRVAGDGGSCYGEEREGGARSMGGMAMAVIELTGRGDTWWEDNVIGNSISSWVPCLIHRSPQ